MATSTTLPGRPVYLPASVTPTPNPAAPGGSFTVSVTLNQAAQSDVTVGLSYSSSAPVSPFSGTPPSSLTVLSGQTTGTSSAINLTTLASGSITVTATTDGGSLGNTENISSSTGSFSQA